MSEYLKIPEVARRLDVSEKTARRYIRSGELPSTFIGGAYRVSEEDLAGYQKDAIVQPEELDAHPKGDTPLPLDSGSSEAERGLPEKYLPWLEFALRYEDRWFEKAKRGDLDESAIREWKATVQDLGKTVRRLREEEERGLSQERILELEDELIMRKVGASLMGPLIPILDAHQALLDEDELARFRRERESVERDLDLAVNG